MTTKESQNEKIIKNEFIINAEAEQVFPLACPVMEYKWIQGWKCKLVYFPDGKIEKGCVFYEFMTAPFLTGTVAKSTKWTCVFYDPKNYIIHFQLNNKISTSLYKIEMTTEAIQKTKCSLELIYIPKNSKGVKLITGKGESKLKFFVSALESMLKTYCETDKMLTSNKSSRYMIYLQDFTKSEVFKLLLNKLLMFLYYDKNRNAFFAGKPVRVSKA